MAKQPRSKAREKGRKNGARAQKLLDIDEIERLRVWGLDACGRSVREGALVVALLGTAGRRFETAALRARDIRLGTGGPEVFFPETKGGDSAVVPISKETFRALSEWCVDKQPNDPLIPTVSGTFMHPATLWRAFRNALKLAGITRQVGVHASRHAAGFLILRATGDLTKVQTFLRHSSIATTDLWYKHVHLPDLRAGLDRAGI